MIEREIWAKAWSLLDIDEKRFARRILGVIVLAALLDTLMVGSVLPFLAVLAKPEIIQENPYLHQIYETFGFTSSHGFLVALGLFALFLIVTSNAMQMLKVHYVANFNFMRIHSFSLRLLTHYIMQPYEYFLNRDTSTMGKNILGECSQVVTQFYVPASDVISSILSGGLLFGLLLIVSPTITLASLGMFGLVYGALFLFIRTPLQTAGEARVIENTGRFRAANEALAGVKDIKVAGQEASYVARFDGHSRRMARSQVIARILAEIPRFAVQMITLSGIILLCLVLLSPDNSSGGGLESVLPVLGVFALAVQKLLPALQRIYSASAVLRYSRETVEAIHADMQGASTTRQVPPALDSGMGLSKQLEFENITYNYPDSKQGLYDFSLTIQQGEKIGIVGSTGAGKTTLADVILGLLEPQNGHIRVDGVTVDQDNLRAWRRTVGYVPQGIFLSHASVAQNIAFGAPVQDMEQVVACARLAQLDRFVTEELEQGYDTVVGERGVRLSGGQRQRIGIARALYHDADLILFDEATSALDNLTERQVMKSIEALPGDKTILMIAHRLSTVRICDRIIVLDKGRLTDVGTWDELMDRSPIFQELVQLSDAT